MYKISEDRRHLHIYKVSWPGVVSPMIAPVVCARITHGTDIMGLSSHIALGHFAYFCNYPNIGCAAAGWRGWDGLCGKMLSN